MRAIPIGQGKLAMWFVRTVITLETKVVASVICVTPVRGVTEFAQEKALVSTGEKIDMMMQSWI